MCFWEFLWPTATDIFSGDDDETGEKFAKTLVMYKVR